jgi:predicted nuclease with TOPRIM domain
LADLKTSLVAKKDAVTSSLNSKIKDLEHEQTRLTIIIEQRNDTIIKLEKKYKQILEDKEKLRQRIMAMRMKSVSNMNQKLCKNCSQEYTEAENFNWSCRTHRV